MMSRLMTVTTRLTELGTDERGEVNVSMIAWMVVAALVVFAFRTQLEAMLSGAAGFVTTTLGI
jgi:hypothetical protein